MPRKAGQWTIEYALLGLLSGVPRHGYDLYKEFNAPNGIGLVWKVGQSKLYALLEKLAAAGKLDEAGLDESVQPARKLYQTSASGREEFRHWMSTPVTHGREMRQEFLARLFFAVSHGQDAVSALIKAQIEACDTWLKNMQTRARHIQDPNSYDHMVLKFRIRQVEGMLVWLEEYKTNAANGVSP